MKANIPRAYNSLPSKEKDLIATMMAKQIGEIVDKEEAEMQKIWLKMACIILHEGFGFGKQRCLTFIGNWKRIYKTNAKFKNSEEQSAWLDERINKIFNGDYPTTFINKMEEQSKL